MERVLLWLDDLEDLFFCLPLLWGRFRPATVLSRRTLAQLAGVLGLVLLL